jgi:hypothetical protein
MRCSPEPSGKSLRPSPRQEERSVVCARYVFIYRNLTETVLSDSQAFLESPVGRRCNVATLAAIDEAMAEAAERLGRRLADTKYA